MSVTPPPIRRVLVANRGEIAARVIRSCRRLGIQVVAVYSDADAEAPYVALADRAVRLPGVSSTETYLDGAAVIAAAVAAGADAIHPGYGFLSENPGFARDVMAAGLTWIGPSPESIDSMALKVEAMWAELQADSRGSRAALPAGSWRCGPRPRRSGTSCPATGTRCTRARGKPTAGGVSRPPRMSRAQ